MRTYTRKPPDYQEIQGVDLMCRLCLGKAKDPVPIFTDSSQDVCAILALRIRMCVGLEITREDILPNKICTECYQELDRYYSFRKRCEATYQKLRSHVLAVRGKQHRALLTSEQTDNRNDVKDDTDSDKLKFFIKFNQDQSSEVNVLTVNGIAENDSSEQLPDETRENNTYTVEVNEGNEQLEDDPNVTGLDISTFLTTMLIQIGILTQQDTGLTLTDQSLKTIELETGDGNVISMQLTEEDEQIDELVFGNPQVMKSLPTETDTDPDAQKQSDIVIKYVTSKYREPKNSSKNITALGSDRLVNTEDNKKTCRRGNTWCDICGKRLATASALSRHRRVHSGEKPYSCRDCGRAFSQREVMLRHRLVHTGDRPHKCATCGAGFTQRGALLAHARSHAPPHERALALHRCARCPKVFLHASGLSRHMMVHNGRVYVCGACSRHFQDKSSLLRHMRNTNHMQDGGDTWAPTAQ